MSVLLVDGNNLLMIGFYGVKNYFYKGQHIGGIYHFLNTLRRSFETYHLNKIVVFWDGEESSISRKKFYPQYKENRKSRLRSEEEISSYEYQKSRVKQYLEELYVRQGEFQHCESDDCIAHYVQNSPEEKKIIFSSDGDMAQLVDENTSLYNPSHAKLYKPNDLYMFEKHEFLIENIKIVKMLCGDPSDNISGIKNLGIKTLLSIFPEITTTAMSIEQIREKTNLLFEDNRSSKLLANMLTGVTKHGVFGDEFYVVIQRMVDLSEPFLTEEAKEGVISLLNDVIDPEGRSYKNTIKMMSEDGLFNVLPKRDDAWTNFFNPFLRLTRKEKNKRLIKIKNDE
jgi:DNA polymerase-1